MKELKLDSHAFLRVLDIEDDVKQVDKYVVVDKREIRGIKDRDIVVIKSEKLPLYSHYIYMVYEYTNYFVLEDYYFRG